MLEGIRQLKAWQLGHELVLEVYRVTKQFPREELFGLTSQLRRAASSVPANIVEGSQSQYTKEYRQFLFTSKRSLAEVEYFIFLSNELGYLEKISRDWLNYNKKLVARSMALSPGWSVKFRPARSGRTTYAPAANPNLQLATRNL